MIGATSNAGFLVSSRDVERVTMADRGKQRTNDGAGTSARVYFTRFRRVLSDFDDARRRPRGVVTTVASPCSRRVFAALLFFFVVVVVVSVVRRLRQIPRGTCARMHAR